MLNFNIILSNFKAVIIILPYAAEAEMQNRVTRKSKNLACNFIKKILQYKCFPVNFANFLRTPFFTEDLVAASGSGRKYERVELYTRHGSCNLFIIFP